MEKELVFQILGIAETADEEIIKAAYRELLKSTHPEDDPEGFKRLRKAYEEALRLSFEIREEETEDEFEDTSRFKSDVELWIDRVEKLYQDILSRNKVQCWQELLSDPVCDGLDTSLEAGEKMILFLMDHIHLPHQIWKMIDDTFEITANMESLQDKFPANFLSYMKYYVENDTFIEYDYFECDADKAGSVNADGYIDNYLTIKRGIDSAEIEDAFQKLNDLKAFSIYHPYEDVERLRLFIEEENYEEGAALAELLLNKYPSCDYVCLYAAKIKWHLGEKDFAYTIWQQILEREPEHYMAKYFCAKHLVEKEDYFHARKLLIELINEGESNEELERTIYAVNEELIKEFREILASEKEDERLTREEMMLKLGWCLLQNKRMEEAEELISHFPEEQQEYEYFYLSSQILYRMDRYEEAVPYLHKWLWFFDNSMEDEEKDSKRRLSEKYAAHSILSTCYYQLGQADKGEEEAGKAIESATDIREYLESMRYLANQLLFTKKYENAVDVCDRILEEDEGYYPAYLIRQEACYYIDRAQQVVNDYHDAIRIYPGYYKPYLFAAKIFFNYSQYEDAKKVIDRAKENQVEFSARLKLCEVKILRNLAESEEERKEPKKLILELSKQLDDENCDIENKWEVNFERGLLCWDDEEYEEAISFFREVMKEVPENPAPFYCAGCVYENMMQEDKALESFEKVLQLNRQYRDTIDKLFKIYRKRYLNNNRQSDYEKALFYANINIENAEDNDPYFERALLYDDALELELAIRDYEKYLEDYPDSRAAYGNMGFAYRALGEYEKAIECFEKSKSLMKTPKESGSNYYQIVKCYLALEQYDKALEAALEGYEVFDSDDYRELMAEVYVKLKQYDEALSHYEYLVSKGHDNIREIVDVLHLQGKEEEEVPAFEKVLTNASDDKKSRIYGRLGDYYYYRLEYEKSIESYLKAISLETDEWQLYLHEKNLAQPYYLAGEYEKAKEHAQKALEHFHNEGYNEEDFLAYKGYSATRLSQFGWVYLCLGDREKAEKYFKKMEEVPPCRFCEYKKCYESPISLARFYETAGEYEKAIELLEEALVRKPDEVEAKCVLEHLRRKL